VRESALLPKQRCHTLDASLVSGKTGWGFSGRNSKRLDPLDRRYEKRLVSLDMAAREEQSPPKASSEGNGAFLAWLSEVPDPRLRYERATEELAKAQEMVQALSAIRSRTVAEVHQAGTSVRKISSDLRMSPARAHQLIQDGKGQSAPPAARQKKPRSKRTGVTKEER